MDLNITKFDLDRQINTISEWDSFNNKYFFNRNDKDGFQLIKEKVSKIYQVMN